MNPLSLPIVFLLFTGAWFQSVQLWGGKPSIHVSSDNAFYWAIDDDPILLLGGTDNDNLFQFENLRAHLELLRSVGGNYVRCTMSSRDSGDAKAFQRNREGYYDLTAFNPEFWTKFADLLRWTAELEIVVQIELWATYDFYWGESGWAQNPFNPALNATYSAESSGLPETIDFPAQSQINPFFKSVPALRDNAYLRQIQEGFVDKILEHTFPYNHVLYCIDNETNAHHAWGSYWATYLRKKAEAAGKQIYITEMWDYFDPTDGLIPGALQQHPDLGGWFAEYTNVDLHKEANFSYSFNRHDLYDFLDISNNNAQKGETHFQTGYWVRQQVEASGNPRPINNVKIYGGDLNRIWSGSRKDGRDRFWRNLFAGHASARFHRPTAGVGLNPMVQAQLLSARKLTGRAAFFELKPAPALMTDRNPDEAYCLANDSRDELLLYFPGKGEVELRVPPGRYRLSWLDVMTSQWQESEVVALPGPVVTPNDPLPWAAHLVRE